MKYLIITADDFGYCKQRNRGIVDCFLKGAVTRSSLLVNASQAREAADLAKKHHIPVGLHLNLTEGSPVVNQDAVDTLLDSDKHFLGKMGFREHLKEGKIHLQQVAAEIQAQIGLFEELCGQSPYYVDGHQHVHVLPGVCEVFADILHSCGISETRVPFERNIQTSDWLSSQQVTFFSQVAEQAAQAQHVFHSRALRFPNSFVGMVTMGSNMTFERLGKCVQEAFQHNMQHNQEKSVPPDCKSSCNTCCSVNAEEIGPSCYHGDSQLANGLHPLSPMPHLPSDNTSNNSHPGTIQECRGSKSMIANMKISEDNHSVSSVSLGPTAGEHPVTVSGANTQSQGVACICELMTHLGYPSIEGAGGFSQGPDAFSKCPSRLHEMDMLTSPRWKNYMQECNITLASCVNVL